MSTTPTLARRIRPVLAVAAIVGTSVGGSMTLAQPALAAPAPAAASATAAMTSSSLLQIEDLRAAGVLVDSGTVSIRGDETLNDAGRFDEGCLSDKTMRAVTGSKSYPEPATARAYADGVWDSTLDKDVWASESIAEGQTAAATDRYVATLTSLIVRTKECQQDPAQGHSYSRPTTVRTGSATATYYYDISSEGERNGGGVAVIRDGNRFGIVSLMFGRNGSAATLKKLATSAAADLR